MTILIPENGLNITEGMAYLYPQETDGISLIQEVTSSEDNNEEIISDRYVAGTVKTRSKFPNLGTNKSFNKKFNIIHPVLNKNQKDWILQFYKINRVTKFNFIWKGDGRTYRVIFLTIPKFTMLGGNWWKVELNLIQT